MVTESASSTANIAKPAVVPDDDPRHIDIQFYEMYRKS